jgi:predicted dienelactone hydrolase
MEKLANKISIAVLVLSWVLIGHVARAAEVQEKPGNMQVKNVDLYDETRHRPVKLTIWYPAQVECNKAIICLAQNTRLDQAAVISHGAMGAAMDYNWIGYAMASQGIVTVGVNHFGESWSYGKENIDPSAVLRFQERPADISFALTQLAKNDAGSNIDTPIFNANINWNNITAIGHSSGGATAIALAGSQLDINQAKAYCANDDSKSDRSCAYMKQQSTSAKVSEQVDVSFRDVRIKRVIAMDPALGHATAEESLHNINIPLMVIGSKQNDFLNFDRHALYYAEQVTGAESLILNSGEGHFIYLDSCTHSYKAMGVSLCTDREGINRDAVHQKIYPSLFRFIFSNAL